MTSTITLRCPKCAGDMATYERSGIVVDQCRECRGIFLDRGELEKLVDAEGGAWVGPQPGVPPQAAYAGPAQGLPSAYQPIPQGLGDRPGPARSDDWDRARSRRDWDDDDDRDDRFDRDDRRRWESQGARPQKRRSILGELLEGFGD